jgi:hypothetical protein
VEDKSVIEVAPFENVKACSPFTETDPAFIP